MAKKKNKKKIFGNFFQFNKSPLKRLWRSQCGQVSRLLLVLAIIILVAVVITYLVMKMTEKPPAPPGTEVPTVPMPVYEETIGDIRFVFMSSIDRGSVLKVSDSKDPRYSTWRQDLTTTERFIQVTVGAQNKGKINIPARVWDIENIVDSDGRNYVPLSDSQVGSWLPENNYCGDLLKPEFEPISCTKIYEVSKISTGLKIRVISGKGNQPGKLSSDDRNEALLDLIVK
jgi:hypothetical protein